MKPYCWLVRRRLGAYQDGELSPGAQHRVEAHVRGCTQCAGELSALGRLRAALAVDTADPPEAVWAAFWPQVRDRIAAPAPGPRSAWERSWEAVRARPRLGLVPALAAAALAVLAVVAPWQRPPQQAPAPVASGLESPESDVTVLWVVGLPRTDT